MCTFYESRNGSNHSTFRKWLSLNRSEVFRALPKFYAAHLGVGITGPYCTMYILHVPNNIKTLNVIQNNTSKITYCSGANRRNRYTENPPNCMGGIREFYCTCLIVSLVLALLLNTSAQFTLLCIIFWSSTILVLIK